MATKTFKIGEYSKGGVITVEISKTKVNFILKNWDMSTGTKRSSDQSKAKEYNRLVLNTNDSNFDRKATLFLLEDTTSYYTDTIMEWVYSKTGGKKQLFW
jgi:hypothetical protein